MVVDARESEYEAHTASVGSGLDTRTTSGPLLHLGFCRLCLALRNGRIRLGFRLGLGLFGRGCIVALLGALFLGRRLGRLLLLLAPLLLGRQRPQLQGVDAALLGHLVAQQGVDHAMPRGLHLGGEDVGDDDEAEVRLLGGVAGHGLVVGVEVRVIVNLQRQRAESRSQLWMGEEKTSAARITKGLHG